MKFNRAWMILLGLPTFAVGQVVTPGGPGPASREPANLQQGAVAREQAGMPGGKASSPQTLDSVKAITRVPIPPEELGLPWGQFQWYPDLQFGLTYDNNLFATRSNPVDDWMWSITPSVLGRSESESAELNVRLGVSVQRYERESRQDANDAWADVQGTVHLSDVTDIFGGASWSRGHEDRGSPDLLFGIEPTVYTDTSLHGGVYHDLGGQYFRFGLASSILDFDSVPTATPGVSLDGDARDRNVYSFGGRWGWRATPETDVFLQGLLERRDYKRSTDLSGFARTSEGYRLDAGVAFDIDRHVVGEAYAGIMNQRYNDPRFENVHALDLGANVRWHTSPWTTYWLDLERSLDDTVVAGSPGYLSTTASARVEHDISSQTLFTGGVAVSRDTFRQITRRDDQIAFNAGLRHYLSDSLYVGADYRYVRRASDLAAANHDRSLMMLTVGTDFGARRRNRYFAYQDRADTEWPSVAVNFAGPYIGLQCAASALQTDSSGLRDQQVGNTDAGELAHMGSNLGIFAGMGWQWDQWYAGIDVTAQAGGNRLAHEHTNSSEPLTFSVSEKSGWSAGLRLGRVLGDTSLLYGRIGWAQTEFSNTMQNLDGSFASSQYLEGLQLGVGAETQLTSSMFWRMDYTVTRYGDYHFVTPSYDERYRNQTATFFVGLGWRLGQASAAPEVHIEPGYLDGVYAGLQVGHGALSNDWRVPQHYHESGTDTLRADFGGMGTTAGGYLGVGHTWGRWYAGAELDVDDARTSWAHERVTSGSGGRDFSVEKKWTYGTSVRLGYVLPNGALLYGRIGAAKTRFNTQYARGNSGTLDLDHTLVGKRWGIGLEVPVSRVTFWRLDYVATDYGDVPIFYSLGGHPDALSWIARDRIFRFGFGVRF